MLTAVNAKSPLPVLATTGVLGVGVATAVLVCGNELEIVDMMLYLYSFKNL
jgi:hypothetical protein